MMRIAVIGAGQGGLQAAMALAQGGAQVEVFEQAQRESLNYDWFDDVQRSVFTDLNIPVPEGSFHGDCASLVAPFSHKPLQVEVPPEMRDWCVERRDLSKALVERAERAGAAIRFGAPVEELIIENGAVRGIAACGEKIYADLVIDSSGALSPFRASLPEEYKITKQPKPHEVFRVYRAFMAPAEGVEAPKENRKKVYLKHLGEMGISWCMCEPDGSVNILVGRTGELEQATLNNALAELKKENPIIGGEVRRGGIICTIPIRYPLSRMAGAGYCAVGDAAFMTIPMIGSGIANSLRAGQMLAEEILKANSVDMDTLWRWQVRYYKEIGAGHYCVDAIKRALLGMDSGDIRYLFDHGVIDKNDMRSISTGEAMVMTPKLIIGKIIKGRRRLGALLRLKNGIGGGEKAEKFALTIPEEFDEEKVSAWQKQADGIFGN